ncbi:hypothetical protein D6861_007330 [Macrococcoides caseolyticum]|nr:hypothetical protein [Macrococcus caseolyticus]RKO16122.1 hypothetical protein D6861_03300 [Macrococcus caseolyticus]
MRYFVTEEWEGPGPVATFIFKSKNNLNRYYLFDDYVLLIHDEISIFNSNFFVAGMSRFSNVDLVNIIKYIFMNDMSREKFEILNEFRQIIWKELSHDLSTELIFEGV